MLAFSETWQPPVLYLTLMANYLKLGPVIRDLQRQAVLFERKSRQLSKPESKRQQTKKWGEVSRVRARKTRLRGEIDRLCGRLLATALYQLDCTLLCLEDLSLSARGTRGALAKAILSMPDDPDLATRALLSANEVLAGQVHVELVNPAYTSQGPHYECPAVHPGQLKRKSGQWDNIICSGCQQPVCSHCNAAKYIRDRGYRQAFTIFPPKSESELNSRYKIKAEVKINKKTKSTRK